MTYEQPILLTPVQQVPLGWEILIACGEDESEARSLFQSHWKRGEAVLAISDTGEFSIWVCKRSSLWPTT